MKQETSLKILEHIYICLFMTNIFFSTFPISRLQVNETLYNLFSLAWDSLARTKFNMLIDWNWSNINKPSNNYMKGKQQRHSKLFFFNWIKTRTRKSLNDLRHECNKHIPNTRVIFSPGWGGRQVNVWS